MTSPGDDLTVRWRYTFCDLLTRTPLARLPLVDADLQESIGEPASGSGTVPLTAAAIRARDPWTVTTPRRTVCFAQRVISSAGREVAAPALWAGIVWGRKRSGRSLSLTMSTVESYWGRRLIARNRTFSRTDDGAIMRTLLADAEAVASGALGVVMPAVTIGTRSDRTVLSADLKTVLETLQSVATNGNGYEWRVEPGWDPVANAFTLTLRQAVALGRTNARSLRWVSDPVGRPGNELIGYELTEDGSNVPNKVTGIAGQAPKQLRSTATAASLGTNELAQGYPLLESALGSDTQDLLTQAALNRHTSAELAAMRATLTQVTSLTVRGDRGPTVETYGLGDTITLQLNDPLQKVPVELSARILARRIQPAQPGRNETVAMTLGAVA